MFAYTITEADTIGGQETLLKDVNRYASRGILLDGNQKIAMMFMSKNGYYKLPGGGLENSETPEMAFIREIREETGCNSIIIKKLGYVEEHKAKTKFLQFSHCFLAKKISSSLETSFTEAEEELGFSLVWMTYSNVMEVMEKSFLECTNYGMKFMLYRELLILKSIESYFDSKTSMN